MKILILNWDYDRFLRSLYAKNPGLNLVGYAAQMQARNDSLFGVANFYSKNFIAHGHQAADIHVNNPWLQWAWAREHGLNTAEPRPWTAPSSLEGLTARVKRRLRPYKAMLTPFARRLNLIQNADRTQREILLAQIENFNPDVVLNQDLGAIGASVLKPIRRKGRTVIAQIGVDPPRDLDLSVYDLGISQIPWVVEFFNRNGLRAERQHLGFEPSILEKLGLPPAKDIAVSFVGSLGSAHGARIALLEAIAEKHALALWTPDVAALSPRSILHAYHCGEVYGREMYNILRRSEISLNNHIGVARGAATNMRLFEATGVGGFLLTDNLADLPELFAPGVQVATYDDVKDCLNKIETYLREPGPRERIAKAGQSHTLQHHTYAQRTAQLLAFIARAMR